MDQTTTIQTVTVVRPLKIIALIASLIALILLIVAVAVNDWLSAEGIDMGLWKDCRTPGTCSNNQTRAWIQVVAAFCLLPMLLIVAAVVCTVLGLINKVPSRKRLFYRVAMAILIVGAVLLLLALIIFPVMFKQEITDYNKDKWYFHWAYGVAWGAWCFMIGAAVLLFFDKETNQVYYKEKKTSTAYDNRL